MLGLLKAHWKKAAMAALFSALIGALYMYRAEVRESAKALAEISHLRGELVEARDDLERMQAEREAALEAVEAMQRDLRELERRHRELREEIRDDEEVRDWMERPLPDHLRSSILEHQREWMQRDDGGRGTTNDSGSH